MTLKLSVQGLLIYLTMAVYVLAFVLAAVRRRRAAWGLYALGFVVALGSVAFRWGHVGHVPLRNLFEVFLALGALVFPLSIVCERVLRVGGFKWDILIGIIILFPAGFVFDETPRQLPPALQCALFAPHVLSYIGAYIIMAKAAVLAVGSMAARDATVTLEREEAGYRLAVLGFPLLTFGLILGAWWAKLAWGDYWSWDPKELWSLATWLIYLAFFHHRAMHGRRYPKANAGFICAGMTAIVITLLLVSLARIFAGSHSYAS